MTKYEQDELNKLVSEIYEQATRKNRACAEEYLLKFDLDRIANMASQIKEILLKK